MFLTASASEANKHAAETKKREMDSQIESMMQEL
jgi:hypothetical protein